MTILLYLAFFASGASGLIYQVIWVREFGLIFGNTVYSAAIVSGAFVLGLGIGSYFAGKIIDRRNLHKPTEGLKFYAFSEFIIAVLGLVISLSLNKFEDISPYITGYQIGENGWFEVSMASIFLRGGIAFFILAPITILMGATLTFLIRYVLSLSIENAGWKIGVLYGINTLGAAIGCATTDLWAIPNIGLLKTKLLAVILNVLAGLLALLLLKIRNKSFAQASQNTNKSQMTTEINWGPLMAIFVSGFCAMGMEIVWLRYIHSLFSGVRISFSIALVVILLGMWLGSFVAGALTRYFRRPELIYIFSQFLFAISTIGGFLFFFSSQRVYFLNDAAEILSKGYESNGYLIFEQLIYLIPAIKIIFFPSVVMGAAFPLVNAIIQKNPKTVGTSAGLIYLWNSMGAILGSLATGFIFLPNVGMKTATTYLALGSLVATIPVFILLDKKKIKQLAFSALMAVTTLSAILYWNHLNDDLLILNGYFQTPLVSSSQELVTTSEGVNETAVVLKDSDNSTRYLITNGHNMSATDKSSQRYMRSFAHVPLLQIENPKSALVICFGVGNTLSAVAKHPSLERIDIVDLSSNILSMAPYFSETNFNVLKDPRVHVYVNDGRQHLRMQPEGTYDLITLEPPPLTSAGVSALYSTEFYKLAMRALKPGGYLTQWLPVSHISAMHSQQLIKAFLNNFPNAVLTSGNTIVFMLMGQKGGDNTIDWRNFNRRIEERPLVKADLKSINLLKPIEWLGTFVSSGAWLTKKLESIEPLSDDHPVIEYSHALNFTTLPKDLFWVGSFPDWCKTCFKNEYLLPELNPLDNYLSLMQVFYWSDNVLKITPLNTKINYDAKLVDTLPQATATSLIRAIQLDSYNKMLDEFPYLEGTIGFKKISQTK